MVPRWGGTPSAPRAVGRAGYSAPNRPPDAWHRWRPRTTRASATNCAARTSRLQTPVTPICSTKLSTCAVTTPTRRPVNGPGRGRRPTGRGRLAIPATSRHSETSGMSCSTSHLVGNGRGGEHLLSAGQPDVDHCRGIQRQYQRRVSHDHHRAVRRGPLHSTWRLRCGT